MSSQEIIEKKYAEAVKGIREEWLSESTTAWYNYVTSLPIDLQITYLIIVFQNQIFNGGFHQYFVNGYGQFAKETIEALNKIKAVKKAELLKEALSIVNSEQISDKEFMKLLLKKEIKPLFIGDELFEPLEELDSQFYRDESEDIELLLGTYLKSRVASGAE